MAKRTERLEIRLTPQEKADLREQADTESMTITELVVDKCLRHLGYLKPVCELCGAEDIVESALLPLLCKECDEHKAQRIRDGWGDV